MAEDGAADRPGVREVVDVLSVDVDERMTSVVRSDDGRTLVMGVGELPSGRRVRLEPGARVELVWKGPDSLLGVPAELLEVRLGDEPTWDMRLIGAPRTVQRRDAVRAPVRLPVRVRAGGEEQAGSTVDLSEGGVRCVFRTPPTDAEGLRPRAAGELLQLSLDLGTEQITDTVALVRTYKRADEMWEASLRFTGLTEKLEDTIRARVFAELRALRAQGLD